MVLSPCVPATNTLCLPTLTAIASTARSDSLYLDSSGCCRNPSLRVAANSNQLRTCLEHTIVQCLCSETAVDRLQEPGGSNDITVRRRAVCPSYAAKIAFWDLSGNTLLSPNCVALEVHYLNIVGIFYPASPKASLADNIVPFWP
jgi:hypothetical protein